MGDIKLSISIKEENNILFKRCVRKLLDSTFIVGDKDEKLYSFISRESNRQDISIRAESFRKGIIWTEKDNGGQNIRCKNFSDSVAGERQRL